MRKVIIAILAGWVVLTMTALGEYKIVTLRIDSITTNALSASFGTNDCPVPVSGRVLEVVVDTSGANYDVDLDIVTLTNKGSSVGAAKTVYSADDVTADTTYKPIGDVILAGDYLRLRAGDSTTNSADVVAVVILEDAGTIRYIKIWDGTNTAHVTSDGAIKIREQGP